MRIALIAPPFIPIPPPRYGGTELFIGALAKGLERLGHEPIVYTNGDSILDCETRWKFRHGEWPIQTELHASLKDLAHSSWACRDAVEECDVLHLNNAPALAFSSLLAKPVVYTLHHPYDGALAEFYAHFPCVRYVAISRRQAGRHDLEGLEVVHHGVDLDSYPLRDGARDYLCTIGRIAPIKGIHTAIATAQRAGIPLKIAGEIQPIYREYWEREIRPRVDGRFIEYIGEVGLKDKCELLNGARAFLFPIEWEEPFGLVMIEAMACGAPVLAFARGSAPEVVADGVSGWLCADAEEMGARAAAPGIAPEACREYVARHFSLERMARQYAEIYARAPHAAIAPASAEQAA